MVAFPHDIPTKTGTAGDFARQLARLIGPAVQAGDGTLAAAEYLALGGALATARTTVRNAIAEATPQTATDLLGEWELMLSLPYSPGVATATRRTRVLARLRAIAGTPDRIENVTAKLAGGTTTVAEYLYSAVTSPRCVFRFVLAVPSAVVRDYAFRAMLDELLTRCSPAHTTWNVGTATLLKFDTPNAGFDDGVFAT